MPADQWACAQLLLDAWPGVDLVQQATGICRRLRDALVALREGRSGEADVAALIRQVLLEHQSRTGIPADLRVPIDPLLPGANAWFLVGCRAWPESGAQRVTADAWHPPVAGPDEATAEDARSGKAAAEDLRQVYLGAEAHTGRRARACPADPFWQAALGYPTYLSVSQRQAARTVAFAPPGSTVIVCLPTGNGKTAVVQAPALLRSYDAGVSVVVVPTVVLALDMERGTRALLRGRGIDIDANQRFAYTGGMPDETKRTIREDIRAGRQRLLFTSPEALMSGLSRAVTEAAEAGLLRFLVIDEAHLVEQWGNEFRPEFQLLAGLRETLLAAAPPGRAPVTVAMSATLTDRHVATLASLFGAHGKTALVWASALRREPAYYVGHLADPSARTQAVLEAVARLPRPLILYASKRQDADNWISLLRTHGFRRVAEVTGDSTDARRQEAVEGWRGESAWGDPMQTTFDIIVGTSAFGLGVDMADVRSIVHACVPETIDRYYQEVGRSGRDGHPSVSYLAWCPTDEPVARNLNEVTVISSDRGWERWQRMQQAAMTRPEGFLELDLDVWPGDMREGFGRNRQWNLRTLNLMQVGGLIRLHALQPPQRAAGESAQQWAERLEASYATGGVRMNVELLDGQVNDPDHSAAVIERLRRTLLQQQHVLLDRMREVIAGRACTGQLLARHYRARWEGGRLGTQPYCRGCPHCRHVGGDGQVGGHTGPATGPAPAVHGWAAVRPDPLERFRGRANWLSIWWTSKQERLDLVSQLLERLARRGLSIVSGPGIDQATADALQTAAFPHPVVVDHDGDLLTTFEGPLVVVLADDATDLASDVQGRLRSAAPTYLLHPAGVVAPERPQLRLIDLNSNHLSTTTALELL
jgi:ATP-dependent DNA helicase RecQ